MGTKKERRLALTTALQYSFDTLRVVDSLASLKGRTAPLVNVLQQLGADPMKEKVLLITVETYPNLNKAGKNIKLLNIVNITSLNIYNILISRKIIIEKSALKEMKNLSIKNT